MAEDDLETGRPRDPLRRGFANSPIGPSQAVTLLLSLMLIGLLVCSPMQSREDVRMLTLARPVETAERVFERNLWIEDAIDATDEPWRQVVQLTIGSLGSGRESAIQVFEDMLQNSGYPRPDLHGEPVVVEPLVLDGLRARHAYLLLEAGRIEEANVDLERLSAAGHGQFVDGLRRALQISRSADTRTFEQYDTSLAGEDWIGTALRLRLARVLGDTTRIEALERDVASRVDDLRRRLVLVGCVQAAVLVLGLFVIGYWLARNRPSVKRGEADVPPAWTFEAGYATAVRAAFGALLIWFVVGQAGTWFEIEGVRLIGAAVSGLPLVWLVRGRLLRPLGATFQSAFGLGYVRRPTSWIPLALAIVTVQWLGSELLVDGLAALGVREHWTESPRVDSLFGAWFGLPLEALVRCAWMPFLVELGARGLLYLTLRRHYGPWQAALSASLLFAAVQFASLPGLATLTWTGLVHCLALEASKSLVPNIAGQVLASAIGLLALYWFWA